MKQRRILLFVAIHVLLFVVLLSAQGPDTVWSKTYGGPRHDDCHSAQQTSDSGYILVGTTKTGDPSYNTDIYLVKTNADGDTLWTKMYGQPWEDGGQSVLQTSDGGYVIAGYIGGGGEPDFDCGYLKKTDSFGNSLWSIYFGYDWSNNHHLSVQEITDGGYIILGLSLELSGVYAIRGFPFPYLIRTNSEGVATKVIHLSGTGWSVKETSDGGFIIVGVKNGDVMLLKTDGNLDSLWAKTYGGANEDVGRSIQKTLDGGYIIAGYTGSFDAGFHDVYLLRVDVNGDTLWTETYGGTNHDVGYSVQQTSDGGYIIGGYTKSYGAGGEDVYVIKTNENGNVLWTQTYGGSSNDGAVSVQETFDGGYMIAGYTESFGAGSCDFYLIKTETDAGIEETEHSQRTSLDLLINPNPFRDKVKIKYSIGRGAKGIELNIYDVSGREIRTFVASDLSSGALVWDGRDNNGEKVSAGVYFLKLEAGAYQESKKLLMVR